MTFANQLWLYLTPAILLIFAGLALFGLRRREALLGRFAAPRLLDRLTEKAGQQRTLLKVALVLLAFAAIGIALARPQYGVEWTERKARGLDIVFVLDSSKSMLATDLRPTRLDRAKLAIRDLVQRLESDRIGLVAFAGNAFLQTPPTLDYSAFRESLDAIGPTTMTRGGSDLGKAIQEAAKAFPKDNNFKVVILLTDGEDLGGNAIETARKATEDGIKVYAIGIGTPEGEYLKVRNGQGTEEFIRDAQGQPVRSQLDESTLQQIAQLTGGSYSRLSDQSLNALYTSVLNTLPREERESELQETHIERFQWPLSAACIFLVFDILIRRRGKVSVHAALLLVCCLPLAPSPAQAQEEPLDANSQPSEISHPESSDARQIYNEAHAMLSKGDYASARQRYQKALESSNDLNLQRDALYNMAHAVNQTGEAALQSQDVETAIENWKEAEALFQSAQEIDPSDTDAIEDAKRIAARRKALEDFLKQQEQNQEQKQEPQDGDNGEQPEDSEQSEDGEQSKDGEQGDKGDQPSDQAGSESEQSEDGEGAPSDSQGEPTQPQDSEEQSSGSGEESTADPVDDMPQPQPDEEAAEEPGEGESMQPTEGTQGDEAGAEGEAQAGAMQIEGMSEGEAQALLDSLRGGEKLLPFVDQTTPGKRRDLRDW